ELLLFTCENCKLCARRCWDLANECANLRSYVFAVAVEVVLPEQAGVEQALELLNLVDANCGCALSGLDCGSSCGASCEIELCHRSISPIKILMLLKSERY